MSSEESPVTNIAHSDGEYFIDPPKPIWALPALFLGTILFSMWTLRSGINLIISIPIIFSYFLLSFVSTRFSFKSASFERNQGQIVLRYVRYGVSWKSLFFGMLGSAFPILLPWFVAINSLAAYPEIADGIMLIAMVIFVLIMPVIPTLASMGNIPILKTSLHASYGDATAELIDFAISVNPLDEFWYERKDDEKILDSIKETVIKLFREQSDVDSFEI